MRNSIIYRIENLLNDITQKMYVTKFWFSSQWKLHIFLTPGTQFSWFLKIVYFSTLFARTLQNKSLNMLRNRFLSHGINIFFIFILFSQRKIQKEWIIQNPVKLCDFTLKFWKNDLKKQILYFWPFFHVLQSILNKKKYVTSQIITLWKMTKIGLNETKLFIGAWNVS